MKTQIIQFPGGYSYQKELQIKDILRRHNENRAIEVQDYDQLDELLEALHYFRVRNVVILHENDMLGKLQRFDDIIQSDYARFFESVEVLPEQFTRLHEAGYGNYGGDETLSGQQQGQGTGKTKGEVKSNIILFPYNQPVSGYNFKTAEFISAVQAAAGTKGITFKGLQDKNFYFVNIVSKEFSRDGTWCSQQMKFISFYNSQKDFEKLPNYGFARDIMDVINYYRKLNIGQPVNVFHAVDTPQIITQALATDSTITRIPFENKWSSEQAKQSFFLGKDIMQDIIQKKIKEIKEDKVAELNEKEPNTLAFIQAILGDLQVAVNNKLPTKFLPGSKDRWDTFKKDSLETMGISALGGQMKQRAEAGGAGILFDAAQVIAKAVKQKQEDKAEKEGIKQERSSQQEFIASHDKFDELKKIFTNNNDKVLIDKIQDNMA